MATQPPNPETTVPDSKEPLPKVQKSLHTTALSPDLPPAAVVKVKKHSDAAILPTRASSGSICYDLRTAMEVDIPSKGRAVFPTDLSFTLPEGTYARIAPKHELAYRHLIDVGEGVIGADFVGPVEVILFNHSHQTLKFKAGSRTSFLIIQEIMTPEVVEVEDLDAPAVASPEVVEVDDSDAPALDAGESGSISIIA